MGAGTCSVCIWPTWKYQWWQQFQVYCAKSPLGAMRVAFSTGFHFNCICQTTNIAKKSLPQWWLGLRRTKWLLQAIEFGSRDREQFFAYLIFLYCWGGEAVVVGYSTQGVKTTCMVLVLSTWLGIFTSATNMSWHMVCGVKFHGGFVGWASFQGWFAWSCTKYSLVMVLGWKK